MLHYCDSGRCREFGCLQGLASSRPGEAGGVWEGQITSDLRWPKDSLLEMHLQGGRCRPRHLGTTGTTELDKLVTFQQGDRSHTPVALEWLKGFQPGNFITRFWDLAQGRREDGGPVGRLARQRGSRPDDSIGGRLRLTRSLLRPRQINSRDLQPLGPG